MRPSPLTVLLSLLCCPLVTGCFPAGYAYPTAALVPSVSVGDCPDRVYAYRIDVTDESCPIDLEETDRYVLTPMSVSGGRTNPQLRLAVSYGWALISPITLARDTEHTVLVRLYRPGFETVEVRSWKMPEIVWKEAQDRAAREKAIDDLVSTWETDTNGQLFGPAPAEGNRSESRRPEGPALFRSLASGSASKGHREALLFAASEYVRLADTLPNGADAAERQRLLAQAAALRERAAR